VSGVVNYPVTLVADNADGALLPGMTALVKLEVARVDHVLAVLDAALRFTPDGAPAAAPRTRLWRRTGPTQAEPVMVRTGLSDGAFTEVAAADGQTLQEGDPIIVGVFRPEDDDAKKPSITLGGSKR
jgi:HlyD family secretion protein